MRVFKGIAPGKNRKALSSLDIRAKTFADDLLQLAFSLNQQVSLLQQVLKKQWDCSWALENSFFARYIEIRSREGLSITALITFNYKL